MTWSIHSRLIDPMTRSTNGFSHGLCGAEITSLMPMFLTRFRKMIHISSPDLSVDISVPILLEKLPQPVELSTEQSDLR